jgi:putative ABC transport system permease protein
MEFRAEGLEMPVSGATPTAYATLASPGFLEALGVRLLRGRLLSDSDRAGAPFVGVINEALAARYFAGQDPLGRRVQLGDEDDPWVEIVGVIASTKNRGLDADAEPELFASTLQLAGFNNQMFLVVRTDGDPYAVLPAIRRAVESLDPEQPVYAVRTIEQAFELSQFRRRFSTTLLGLFGGFALVLAAVGIYGVVSYATSQRTREVGVRMALGAKRADVTRLFVRQAMIPVGIGAVLGAVAAFGVGRVMTSLLFEVEAGDPITIGAAGLVLAAVGVLAAWVPARRASRLDPVRALRVE